MKKTIEINVEDVKALKSSAQELIQMILQGECKNNMLVVLSEIMETTQKIINEEVVPDYIKQDRG